MEDYGQEPEGGRPEDEDEDEKVLEELEDKQLLARIAAIEGENHNLKEQVFVTIFLLYRIFITVTCIVLLFRPHSKLGQHCALRYRILTKRINRRCAYLVLLWSTLTSP